MRTRHDRSADPADPRRPQRDRRDEAGDWPGGEAVTRQDGTQAGGGWSRDGGSSEGRTSQGRASEGRTSQGRHNAAAASGGDLPGPGAPVVRTATGWRVGEEEVSDLTSAMVLADLLAADLPAEGPPTPAGPPSATPGPTAAPHRAQDTAPEIRKLQETVAQLEHALTVRVRVEQAIGVLAERHRLRPRQAFELLRTAARTRGRRVMEVANEVVDSATNPLLRIPEELAKPPVSRRRGRLPRHMLGRE